MQLKMQKYFFYAKFNIYLNFVYSLQFTINIFTLNEYLRTLKELT